MSDDAPPPEFTFRGPWFTSKEATAYIPCKNVRAFYEWRKRHGIVARGNGAVAKADLDRALKVCRKRHAMSPASIANLAKSPKRMAKAAGESDPVEQVEQVEHAS